MGAAATLRVGIIDSSYDSMPQILRGIRERYPDLEIHEVATGILALESAATRRIEGSELNERLLLDWNDVPGLVFQSEQDLLQDQSAPARRAKALAPRRVLETAAVQAAAAAAEAT